MLDLPSVDIFIEIVPKPISRKQIIAPSLYPKRNNIELLFIIERMGVQKCHKIFLWHFRTLVLFYDILVLSDLWHFRTPFYDIFVPPWFYDILVLEDASKSRMFKKFYDIFGCNPYDVILSWKFLIYCFSEKAQVTLPAHHLPSPGDITV